MTPAGPGIRALALLVLLAAPLSAQQPPVVPRPTPVPTAVPPARALSLAEALRLAETQSEAVRIASAGVRRAQGQRMQARSAYLPQLDGSLNYTRTLKTQFEVFQADDPLPPPGTPPVPPPDTTTFFPPCNRYLAPAGAPDSERLAALEQYSRCTAGGGVDFARAGFGAANQWNIGLTGSMALFAGGRNVAQNRAAEATRRAADIELTAQRAQLTLDVTEAYYDAALADRLVSIAESSLVQTETALRQTRLARQVGNQSEFDLLRAQVTRDNQVPNVLQARTQRDLAYLRLKQILNLGDADSLELTDRIGDVETSGVPAQQVANLPPAAIPLAIDAADTSAAARAPVRQLAENVTASQEQVRIARAEWFPNVTLSSSYGRVAFPSTFAPDWNSFLTNWTVSVGASMPFFTGGRIRGQKMVAEANLAEARARLDQTRELAALNARQVAYQLQQAEAQLAASAGTATQAQRAYRIAEVRYTEGISTTLELAESRVLLQQALANRAQAARDLQVARVRLALLKDLPLGTTGGIMTRPAFQGGAGAAGGTQGTTQPQLPRTTFGSTSGTGQ
jgi:outer membrane protein